MSNYDIAAVRKRVGLDEHGCMCCDASECCGELPSALCEIDHLSAEVTRLEAIETAARATGLGSSEWANRLDVALAVTVSGKQR